MAVDGRVEPDSDIGSGGGTAASSFSSSWGPGRVGPVALAGAGERASNNAFNLTASALGGREEGGGTAGQRRGSGGGSGGGKAWGSGSGSGGGSGSGSGSGSGGGSGGGGAGGGIAGDPLDRNICFPC